ncbi:MAG: peptidoglycan recognition family protein [Patescibacteria group bacterium]
MIKNNPKYLIIHHTGGTDADPKFDTSNQSFEVVNEYHRQKWDFKSSLGFYLGYQYFIDKNGKVTQGRADSDEGAHTIGKNLESIGICMAGNFDVTMPTTLQIQALKTLIKNKMALYSIPLSNVVPHRKFAVKSCYGNLLGDYWAQVLVDDTPIIITPSACVAEKDIIKVQEQQISRLQQLINSLIKIFK